MALDSEGAVNLQKKLISSPLSIFKFHFSVKYFRFFFVLKKTSDLKKNESLNRTWLPKAHGEIILLIMAVDLKRRKWRGGTGDVRGNGRGITLFKRRAGSHTHAGKHKKKNAY